MYPPFALDDVADGLPLETVHGAGAGPLGKAPDFEDDARPAIVEDHHLRIGGLAVVNVSQAASDAHDARREFHLADRPSRHVHLVDALVAQVAVAGVPNPVPVVMQSAPHEGQLRRRAAPEVVVYALRNGLRPAHLADAVAAFVTQRARDLDLADVALLQPVPSLPPRAAGSALGTSLHDPPIRAGGVDGLAALPDGVGHGLLDVDVLASLTRPDGDQRVPVVRRRRSNDVYVPVVEHLADVEVGIYRYAPIAERLRAPVEDVGVAVA
jgi:hypothetical protein